MAATGKTPILLYGSTTPTNAPTAGNLTNSTDGCEIAINVADKNLFFKDSTNAVNTVPIRQSSAISNGWLSSTDWSTFNGKAPAFTYTSGYIPYGQGTTTPTQSSSLTFDGTTLATNSFTATGTSLVGYDGGQYTNQLGVSSLVPYFAQYKWTGSGSNYYATKVINNDGAWTLQTAAAAAVGSHSFSTVFQVAQSGGVSIGNTTDPGAGSVTVNGKLYVHTVTDPTPGSVGTNAAIFLNSLNDGAWVQTLQSSGAGINRGQAIYYSGATPNDAYNEAIYFKDSTTERFIVASNGGVKNYSANNVNLSDERVKKDITLAPNYLEKICQIPVKNYLYKDQTDTELNLGVIAQDVQKVAPELVCTSGGMGLDENGNDYLTIYETDLVYALMKSIQELNAEVQQLKQKLEK